ncbi:AI-2E family transporter [bacterium]|nr:AI-2E family transporter [bacterium]
MHTHKKYTFDRVVRIGITAGVLYCLLWFLERLSDVLFPFAVAMLLAYCINPLVRLVQKKIKHRVVSVFISLILVFCVLVLFCWIIVPEIINEITSMGPVIKEVVNSSELADKASKQLPPDIWKACKEFLERKEVQNFFRTDKFWEIAESSARKVLPGVWGIITGTTSFVMSLFGVVIIGLYLVFLLIDYEDVTQNWKKLIPPSYKDMVLGFLKKFNMNMNSYFRAQAIIALIVGILHAVGFMLIGLPMAILLGLFIGLLNMVPYLLIFGYIPAFILAIVGALKTGSGIWAMLGMTLLVFACIQALQDTILVPRIMGDVTGLNPVTILLSLSIWGKLLGVFGMLIALPMTCLLLAYYNQFIESQLKNANSVDDKDKILVVEK